ncbi:MAG TPA: nuclear transport factor 2 family protein [Polyangiaceae bacterium]
MTDSAATRRVVEAYFDAWTQNRIEDAYALLADDLHFTGPSAEYRTRAEFRPGLVGFAGLRKSSQKVELLVEGDRAALLYDCELPPPAGKMRIASFFQVAGGRITRYDTRFDAEGFRQLLAALQKK